MSTGTALNAVSAGPSVAASMAAPHTITGCGTAHHVAPQQHPLPPTIPAGFLGPQHHLATQQLETAQLHMLAQQQAVRMPIGLMNEWPSHLHTGHPDNLPASVPYIPAQGVQHLQADTAAAMAPAYMTPLTEHTIPKGTTTLQHHSSDASASILTYLSNPSQELPIVPAAPAAAEQHMPEAAIKRTPPTLPQKAPPTDANINIDNTAAAEPPHKVICASRRSSPAGPIDHAKPGTTIHTTINNSNHTAGGLQKLLDFNPQFPFPARPTRPLNVAPLPCPLGSTWAASIACGPPLIVADGFELPSEPQLAPQPELAPQKAPKPPQANALLSRWAIDPQAALLAAQGRTPPPARKPAKPRRTANRARARQPSPAAKAAAAAAAAAKGTEATSSGGNVPNGQDMRHPDSNNACATADGPMEAGNRAQNPGLPPLAASQPAVPQVVELAHEWWEVRLQWRATSATPKDAPGKGDAASTASLACCSEGDVCVARFLEASHAQASILSTGEMLTRRTVPGTLPDLQHEWHLHHMDSNAHPEQSLQEQEAAEAGALLRVQCSTCTEKWHLVRHTDPTAQHELVQRPVTIQESPWQKLMSWHHSLNSASTTCYA